MILSQIDYEPPFGRHWHDKNKPKWRKPQWAMQYEGTVGDKIQADIEHEKIMLDEWKRRNEIIRMVMRSGTE